MHRRAVIRALLAAAGGVAVGDAVVLARRRSAEPAATAPSVTTAPSSARTREVARAPSGADAARSDAPTEVPPSQDGPTPADAAADPDVETSGVPQPLPVVCRTDWGAQPPSGSFTGHRPTRLTVHHTAVLRAEGAHGPERVRGHQRHHLDAGFADLAYHFVVDRDGVVFEGRPVDAVGETFTDYDPAGHFLPCLEGDFTRQEPSAAQVSALAGLLAWAAGTFQVDPATLAGHRAYAATACPGDALQRLLDDGTLLAEVTQRLSSGGVRLEPTC